MLFVHTLTTYDSSTTSIYRTLDRLSLNKMDSKEVHFGLIHLRTKWNVNYYNLPL